MLYYITMNVIKFYANFSKFILKKVIEFYSQIRKLFRLLGELQTFLPIVKLKKGQN